MLDPSRLLGVEEGRVEEDSSNGLPCALLEPVQKGFLIAVLLELGKEGKEGRTDGGRERRKGERAASGTTGGGREGREDVPSDGSLQQQRPPQGEGRRSQHRSEQRRLGRAQDERQRSQEQYNLGKEGGREGGGEGRVSIAQVWRLRVKSSGG